MSASIGSVNERKKETTQKKKYDAVRLQFMTEMGGVVSIHYASR
jgi:hypothetical protein